MNTSQQCQCTSEFSYFHQWNQASQKKDKVTSFVKATFSYSAVQSPFDINFFWSSGYIMKLAFGSLWRRYFTPSFVRSQHTVPKNIKLAHTLSMVPIHPLVELSFGYSFLMPEKKSNHGPHDLQSNALPIDQRTSITNTILHQKYQVCVDRTWNVDNIFRNLPFVRYFLQTFKLTKRFKLIIISSLNIQWLSTVNHQKLIFIYSTGNAYQYRFLIDGNL